MQVTFESIICAWDENIPALLIQVVNTILFCRDEQELRESVKQLRERQNWISISSMVTVPIISG